MLPCPREVCCLRCTLTVLGTNMYVTARCCHSSSAQQHLACQPSQHAQHLRIVAVLPRFPSEALPRLTSAVDHQVCLKPSCRPRHGACPVLASARDVRSAAPFLQTQQMCRKWRDWYCLRCARCLIHFVLPAHRTYCGADLQPCPVVSIDVSRAVIGAGGTMSGGSSSLLQHETAAPGTAR